MPVAGAQGEKHYGVPKIQAEGTHFWLSLPHRFLNKWLALTLVLDISFLTGAKKICYYNPYKKYGKWS